MPDYWFVVRSGNHLLLQTLRRVLEHRTGFHVITERRASTGRRRDPERRRSEEWVGDDLVIARSVEAE